MTIFISSCPTQSMTVGMGMLQSAHWLTKNRRKLCSVSLALGMPVVSGLQLGQVQPLEVVRADKNGRESDDVSTGLRFAPISHPPVVVAVDHLGTQHLLDHPTNVHCVPE